MEPLASPIRVQADPVRLKQVLLNLASNAIKFNDRAGEVRIAVSVDRPRARVRIDVRDSGPGLTREQRDNLFQPFNRLGREDQNIPGTGIGLVLVKHLVEAMEGDLTVDSEPGMGCCFSVLLAAA
jgi:signal transduction histidine kinase